MLLVPFARLHSASQFFLGNSQLAASIPRFVQFEFGIERNVKQKFEVHGSLSFSLS
jgi:hypothetical protein